MVSPSSSAPLALASSRLTSVTFDGTSKGSPGLHPAAANDPRNDHGRRTKSTYRMRVVESYGIDVQRATRLVEPRLEQAAVHPGHRAEADRGPVEERVEAVVDDLGLRPERVADTGERDLDLNVVAPPLHRRARPLHVEAGRADVGGEATMEIVADDLGQIDADRDSVRFATLVPTHVG